MTRPIQLTAAFLAIIIATSAAPAQILPGQAITWANFDYVYDVASSISHVYFVTNGGIICYNKMEHRWELPLTGQDGLTGDTPQRIWVDRFDQQITIQTNLSYYQYDQLFDRWSMINELPEMDIYYQQVPPPSHLMPSFDANAVRTGEFVDNFGRSIIIQKTIDDYSGDLWIGTRGFGPAKAHAPSGLTELLTYGLLQTRVNTICPDDSILWLGGALANSPRSGISGFNVDDNSFVYAESGLYSYFPANDVNCLAADSEHIYIGTPSGLYILTKHTWQTEGPLNRRHGLTDGFITTLLVDSLGLFVGSALGLDRIDLATDSVFHIRPDLFGGQIIYDIERIGSSIWVGSSGGAFRYSPDTHRLQQFQDPELVLFSRVYDIEFDHEFVWFSSDDGVARLNQRTGKSWSYRVFSARLDSRAMAINDKVAAIASDNGMTLIFYNREKPFSREFTTDDGLPSSAVFDLLMDGDFIWIGSDKGLTRFWWNNPARVD